MTQGKELDRLEGFVVRLLARYNDLLGNNDRLIKQLDERNEIIARLQQELDNVGKERLEITNKISTLVEKIEEWEAGINISDFEPETTDKNSSGVQGNLFAEEQDNIRTEE